MHKLLGLLLFSCAAQACDVGTRANVVGWNPKTKQVLVHLGVTAFQDGDTGIKEIPLRDELFSFDPSNSKLRAVKARPPGFAKYSAQFLKSLGGEQYEWQGKKLKLELTKARSGETGAYSLYVIEPTRKLVRANLATTTLSATEQVKTNGLFGVGGYVVGLHEGCGSIQMWAIPIKSL